MPRPFRRIGRSQTTGNPSADGTGGGVFDIFGNEYFQRNGTISNIPYVEVPFAATGGNLADGLAPGNGYKYHTFGTPGTFTVTSGSKSVELFMIGGGGGGAPGYGGGGGAGALIYRTSVPVTGGSYPITVGVGGTGVGNGTPNPSVPDANLRGSSSTALGFTAQYGGVGWYWPNSWPGGTAGPGANSVIGGSSGGMGAGPGQPTGNMPGSSTGTPGGTPNSQSPPTGWGNPGGANGAGGSGGGGAGGAGQPQGPQVGGAALTYTNFAGPLIGIPALNPLSGAYAGGGGGGSSSQFASGSGGAGGGAGAGNGGYGAQDGTDATQYTGSGGGGGGHAPGNGYGGGDGGPGIVVIRYLA